MKKLCSFCRKELIPVTERRCSSCNGKLARDRPKIVSSNEKFYKTNRWNKLSKYIRNKYHNLDLYELMVNKKIVPSKVVHHIIPVDDDESKKYDENNLIPLSLKSHRLIENIYKNGDKEKMQKLLLELVKKGMV